MTKFGFKLDQLSLIGKGLEEATVRFSDGLNVIYGPSDTGKTFIVQCIDFVFGGKNPPKPIDQAEGYDKISLSISSRDSHKEFVLERALKGGDIMLLHDGPHTKLSQKHNSKKKDNISRFLLGLSGLDGKRVRINAQGMTNSLSFRDIAKLVIIDEQEVIREKSPYLTENNTSKTKERSIFRLLLTGNDDSEIVASEDPKISKARQETKINFIKELIDERSKEMDDLEVRLNEGETRQAIKNISNELEKLNEETMNNQDALDALEMKRRSLWDDYNRARSELSVISELGIRFLLLDSQYRSDLARLQAISEAGFRLAQIPEERCPVCGALPEYHQYEHAKPTPPEDLAISYENEALKIRCLIKGLSETRKSNDNQIEAICAKVERLNSELIADNRYIKSELEPRFQAVTHRIRELTDKQPIFLRALYLYECTNDLETQLELLLDKKLDKPDKDVFPYTDAKQIEEFCNEVERVLQEWKYPNLNRVTFSESDDDIIISGQRRKSHGKGVRAITHTAFNLGLLKFCLIRLKPHPGLLIVDSPLVVYKQADPEDEDFPIDVKEAFYRSLSTVVGVQTIICENDAPPSDLPANFIHFTGTDEGRYGFIPRKDLQLSS